MLEVTPINLEQANAFVSLLHRHHKPVPGAKCARCHTENGHARQDKAAAFRDFDLAYKRTIAALYDAGKLVVKP